MPERIAEPAAAPDGEPRWAVSDAGARIDALRAEGAHRIHPVKFRFIESLARRAALAEGATRRRLDERVASLLRDYAVSAGRATETTSRVEAAPSPLAGLLEHIARQAGTPEAAAAPAGQPTLVARAASAAGAPSGQRLPAGELKTIRYFRRTWARLGAEQKLAQSRSALPENAGPLHSHQLVHRAMRLMQDLSPEYLERFIGHVEALQWLELAVGGSAPATAAPAPRADAERKGTRTRRG